MLKLREIGVLPEFGLLRSDPCCDIIRSVCVFLVSKRHWRVVLCWFPKVLSDLKNLMSGSEGGNVGMWLNVGRCLI